MSKNVLITGACSGIGLDTVKALSKCGWQVVATGKCAEDLEAIQGLSLPNVSTFVMDVMNPSDIKSCKEYLISHYDGRLDVLINNAGIWLPGSVEMMPIEDVEYQLKINAVAPLAVIKAFLPVIKSVKGRIINVSSMNGRVSMIGTGGYSASKYALEAMIDALRMELFGSGVSVVLVEPGQIRTGLFDKAQEYFDGLYGTSGMNECVDCVFLPTVNTEFYQA